LASLNLERYEDWREVAPQLIADCVKGLDNNLETFCETAPHAEFKKAVFSARQERSIGLGVMGYHGYLMQKRLPFESVAARLLNKELFERIGTLAREASAALAQERGLPGDGGTRRNSYVTSIQPTASTAFLCGQATPCIEPISGNAYLQKTLSGSFLVKNRYLAEVLEEKGQNTPEVWSSIISTKGTVRHLSFLTDEEKAVFRTAYEMNMREIIEQAADRQPYIDQAQSINLFFATPISGKYLDDVHTLAWKRGVKTLYYVRSSSLIQATAIGDGGGAEIPQRDVANEECAVCQ
jgi:ribonucleoside-diphosphate reductase alpha chain